MSHLYSTMICGVPRCYVTSGFRRSRVRNSKVPAAGNPECRSPDSLDSCHLSALGSTVLIKSGDRTSRFRRACGSRTRQPRSPIRTERFSPRLRTNRLVTPPGSNDPRDFASLPDKSKSSILFLYEEISAPPPSSCAASSGSISSATKGLSSLRFVSNSFEILFEHAPYAQSSITSESVEIF
jgi:hypothetical protein